MEFFQKRKGSSVLEKLLNATNNTKWPKGKKSYFLFVVVAAEMCLIMQPWLSPSSVSKVLVSRNKPSTIAYLIELDTCAFLCPSVLLRYSWKHSLLRISFKCFSPWPTGPVPSACAFDSRLILKPYSGCWDYRSTVTHPGASMCTLVLHFPGQKFRRKLISTCSISCKSKHPYVLCTVITRRVPSSSLLRS